MIKCPKCKANVATPRKDRLCLACIRDKHNEHTLFPGLRAFFKKRESR